MQKHTIEIPAMGLAELGSKLEAVEIGQDCGTLVQYPAFVANLFKDMHAAADSLMHAAAGIAGEGGEILDIAKKVWVYGKPLDVANIVEELGDMRFYYQAILNMLNLTDEHIKAHNMFKLSLGENARFPDGVYTDAAAIARADKAAEGETTSSGLTGGE